jgi:glutamate-1-semialdehyde 2,1-aminomutase
MNNCILNEGYNKKIFFEKGYKDKIFIKKKSYIDLSNNAGALILGHNSKIYTDSVKKYLKNQISTFAHPNKYALEFSKNIKKRFNTFSNIIFCNSGSEAIIRALRISRAINKKKIIVSVAGSWHGSVDKLLFYPNKRMKPIPLSSGLENNDKKNIIYIPNNNIIGSKKILKNYKKKINCIIIEPLQASFPVIEKKYLKFLEKFCKINKCNLIFDEMITGLRMKEGSIQKIFNIKPDIITLGKILGGGTPIGVVGITKKIYQKIKTKKIFFGGTFSANSFTSFIGNETIKFLGKNVNLYKNLNNKCEFFEKNLNKFFKEKRINATIYRYQSIIKLVFSKQKINALMTKRDFLIKNQNLNILKFKNFLMKKGIYFPPNGTIFFSTALTDKNLNYILGSFKEGLKKYFG